MATSKAMVWGGRAVSALPVLGLLMSGSMKLMHRPEVVAGFTGKFGYPESVITPLGVVEVLAAVLYVVPQTSVLGALLLTGYLGGAIATHVRVSDPFMVPLIMGIMVVAGLFLRDDRLRALLPLRKPA